MLLIISSEQQGKRLDSLIFENAPENISRGIIQKQIKNGEVTVDKKKIRKPSFPVEENSRVVIHFAEPEPEYIPEAEDIPLEVLFENDDMLIISKSSGMCTHPDDNYKSGTVVNAVMGYLQNHQKTFIDEKIRPGIVHRLDKDTSGCLMIAKNPEMHRYLSKIIAERKITKKYTALLLGRIPSKKGTIDSPISRDPYNRERMTTIENHKSKDALTHFEVLAEFPEPSSTLAKVHIITGRTHQIRVHFSAIGHPVLGDDLYGNPKENKSYFIHHPTTRMFLHASFLSLPLPNGEIITVESDLPKDLAETVEKLKERVE